MIRLNINRTVGISLLALCLTGRGFAAAIVRDRAPLSPCGAVRFLADDKKDTKEEEPKGDPVEVDKLPKKVVEIVKKTYPGAVISKAAKLEDGNYYLDDVKVGKKVLDITVSPEGKIVKEKEMKEGE